MRPQRRWQLAQLAAGDCQGCGQPRAAGDPLYCGRCRLANRLRPNGVFGLWSNDPPDQEFLATLAGAFAAAQAHVVEFHNPLQDCTAINTVYVCRNGD